MKNKYENQIEVITRAVILDKGKILLCKSKIQGHYFFPGGHVEFGERLEKALAREIKEELNIKVIKTSLIGMVDNMYREEGKKRHEINFIFEAKVDKIHTQSQEDHISFKFFSRAEFTKEKKIYPVVLKKQLLKWFKDKKFFSISQ